MRRLILVLLFASCSGCITAASMARDERTIANGGCRDDEACDADSICDAHVCRLRRAGDVPPDDGASSPTWPPSLSAACSIDAQCGGGSCQSGSCSASPPASASAPVPSPMPVPPILGSPCTFGMNCLGGSCTGADCS